MMYMYITFKSSIVIPKCVEKSTKKLTVPSLKCMSHFCYGPDVHLQGKKQKLMMRIANQIPNAKLGFNFIMLMY